MYLRKKELNRSLYDIKSVTSIITGLDSNISSNSVVVGYRLGKFYSQVSRQLPILAKFKTERT